MSNMIEMKRLIFISRSLFSVVIKIDNHCKNNKVLDDTKSKVKKFIPPSPSPLFWNIRLKYQVYGAIGRGVSKILFEVSSTKNTIRISKLI